MPHSTVEFPFEEIVFAFACDYSKRHVAAMRSFLLLADDEGNVISTQFSSTDTSPRQLSNAAALAGDEDCTRGAFFFDPFDWPEYAWVAWKNINRPAMERLISVAFDESAFLSPLGLRMPWPSNWSFMI
ncbi:MAG: hypothetical protein R3C17_10815 [Planctomycetaceae bacterium]